MLCGCPALAELLQAEEAGSVPREQPTATAKKTQGAVLMVAQGGPGPREKLGGLVPGKGGPVFQGQTSICIFQA